MKGSRLPFGERGIICAIFLFCSIAQGADIEGKNFPDFLIVGTEKLVLNGVGLRRASKFGITVKVYVAALFLKKKSNDAATIMASKDVKHLALVFLRLVDKSTLRDAWDSGHFKNCMTDCEASKLGLIEFNKLMVDMREDSQLIIDVYPDKVEVEIQSRENKTATIANPAFAKNILGIFIGKEPPTEDLKKGLLQL